MAKFNMKDPNPGVWFDYDDSGARVKVRAFNQQAMIDIRKACVKDKVRYIGTGSNRRREEYTETNDDKIRLMIRDYTIVDWEGIKDQDGNEIECTAENKCFLMDNVPAFQTFIDEAVVELGMARDQRIEDEEKN